MDEREGGGHDEGLSLPAVQRHQVRVLPGGVHHLQQLLQLLEMTLDNQNVQEYPSMDRKVRDKCA